MTVTGIHDRTMGRWNNIDEGHGQSLGGFRIVALRELAGDTVQNKLNSGRKLAQNLARDMTFKWTILHRMLADMRQRGDEANVQDYEVQAALMGGGKSVAIFDDEAYSALSQDDMRSFLHQHGDHVERLGGKHNTAPDMGTNSKKMGIIRERTKWVSCYPRENGATEEANPSPITADGVWYSAEALIEEMGIENPTFAVQGVGEVGSVVVDNIFANRPDAVVYVTEFSEENWQKFIAKNPEKEGTQIIRINDIAAPQIYQVADVFMPCAQAEILNEQTTDWIIAPESRTRIIAGSANDQYTTDEHGAPLKSLVDKLHRAGEVAATAWVINGGGIDNVATEFHQFLGDLSQALIVLDN